MLAFWEYFWTTPWPAQPTPPPPLDTTIPPSNAGSGRYDDRYTLLSEDYWAAREANLRTATKPLTPARVFIDQAVATALAALVAEHAALSANLSFLPDIPSLLAATARIRDLNTQITQLRSSLYKVTS